MRLRSIGGAQVAGLCIGGNPFSGFSHQTEERSRQMRAYYTDERIHRTLRLAEASGINTFFGRTDDHIFQLLRTYWEQGGRIQWFAQVCTVAGDADSWRQWLEGAARLGATCGTTSTTGNTPPTVTTTAGGIVTVTNAGTLSIAAAADMSLTGAFTQDGAGSVTTSGDITTTADAISFLRAVTLSGAVALNSANGNITFSSTINGAQTLSLTAGTGAVTVTGIVGTSAISANRLASFTVVSAASVALSSVFTSGAQSVTGTAITLTPWDPAEVWPLMSAAAAIA